MPGQTERPTLDYAVVCDDVRFERDGKISLMGVFDAINVDSFPWVHNRVAIVAAWMGVNEGAKSEIDLVGPDGNVLARLGAASLKQTGEQKGARHITISFNVPFKTSGIHQIRISLDGVVVRNIPLPVRSVGTPRTGFGRLGQALRDV